MHKIGNLVGLVGWRGMVGSVLMDRMQAEGDFALIEPVFFSTSAAGGEAPAMAKNETTLKDAFDIDALKRCDIVITCQGGDYTNEVFPKLRAAVLPAGSWRMVVRRVVTKGKARWAFYSDIGDRHDNLEDCLDAIRKR